MTLPFGKLIHLTFILHMTDIKHVTIVSAVVLAYRILANLFIYITTNLASFYKQMISISYKYFVTFQR